MMRRPAPSVAECSLLSKMNTHSMGTDILNGATFGKFVLFGIPRADQVKDGPVMRGLVEVKTKTHGAPVKVQVAAWLKIGRSSGTEYLSLKVGNNNPDGTTALVRDRPAT
jgi:hypothetical protein